MTTVQAERTSEQSPFRFLTFRGRRAWAAGALATVIVVIATIVAARNYSVVAARDEFKLALAAIDRRDFAAARRATRELRASNPSSPQASFLRGAMLLEKGYCFPALHDLEKAKQDAGLEIESFTLIGEAWYRLGRHVEAQAAFERVLMQSPDSIEAHRWLAASYYDQGVVGKALGHLKRTAELDPADPRPHRLLGLIHKDFWHYQGAIPYYEESLKLKNDQPDATQIRLEMATCQIETGRYRDALATLARCPDLAEFNVLRAKCYHAQGDLARAKAALARSQQQDNANFDALLLKGTILLEEGEAGAAVEAFQNAVRQQPKDYTAHFKLAQAYGQAGQKERSEVEQQTAEGIRAIRHEFAELHKGALERPDDIEVRLRLADLARQLERPDLADVWLRSAAALRPVPASDNK